MLPPETDPARDEHGARDGDGARGQEEDDEAVVAVEEVGFRWLK